ncbi:ankyrin repeat domain-containing protein [Flaviramulus basaltis]|nr:ankyrin repeat domain-containing protein [Flaviramulus basaltis]
MKHLTLIILSLFSNFIISSQEKDIPFEYPFGEPGKDDSRGVYGNDDRKDVTDAEGIGDFVRATASMINKSNLIINDDGNYLFYGTTLRDRLVKAHNSNNFDKNVKFLDQPTIAVCTGFLIAPDILVTAGHCIDNIYQAENYVWVFDYTNELDFIQSKVYNGKKYIVVDPKNVYEVSEVIASLDDDMEDDMDDYSILRLKLKSDRDPYRFRTSGEIGLSSKIYTIGSPSGLPLKFADNATVLYNSEDKYFQTDIDVFPGNSGGPAFAQFGFLEGIVVRTGAKSLQDGSSTADYMFDQNCNCIQTLQFSNAKNAYPSDIHRIKEIPYEIIYMTLYENLEYAIENGLNDRLEAWLRYSWIIDHEYTVNRGALQFVAAKANNLEGLRPIMENSEQEVFDNNGRNLLFYAIENDNLEMVEYLLEQRLLINLEDNSNKTPLQHAVLLDKDNLTLYLINNGGDVNKLDDFGNNLLHYAAINGNLNLSKTLVDKGVSAKTKNYDKKYPEKLAKKNKHKVLARYLKKVRKSQ